MRIKKYEASDMKEAIKMIKHDFGSEAVILHSRTINKGGMFGLFAKERIEVMAGIDVNIVENTVSKIPSIPKMRPVTAQTRQLSDLPPIVNTAYTPKIVKRNQEFMPITSTLEKRVTSISKELEDMKETMHLIVKKVANAPHPMISPKLIMYYQMLEHVGLGEELIINLLQEVEANFRGQELENIEKITSYIKQKVTNLFGNVYPIDFEANTSSKIVALVGPTGVGKTTTIAKMAANFSIIQKKKTALITIDTFRIAAIEQLRNYANIIGIPLEVVFNLEDFSRVLRKFKDMDLILIDTAGRSPKNNEQILELKKFIKNPYIDTHLVLSATSKPKDLFKTVQRYEVLGGDKVIFTKLDETDSAGVMVDVINTQNKKLSYFTNGQNVPDDLEVAYPIRLANLLFSDVANFWGGNLGSS